MKKIAKFIPFLFLFSLIGCESGHKENIVFTSFYPVYEFTSRVVKDLYEIENLTPPGSEPHDFELSPKKIASLIDSKALMINGLNMESWAKDLPSKVLEKTCVVSENIETITTMGQIDPHIWLNPLNAIKEMENIASFMSKIDEDNKDAYSANYEMAKSEFLVLDNELLEISNNLTQKNIVVAHAAYGYMCDRYGLNQIAINGIEPDQEPTAKTIEAIIEAVDTYHINTIFTEELISSKVSEIIVKECGVKVEVLSPLESIDDGEDYISVMKENMQKIKEASHD